MADNNISVWEPGQFIDEYKKCSNQISKLFDTIVEENKSDILPKSVYEFLFKLLQNIIKYSTDFIKKLGIIYTESMDIYFYIKK